MIKKLSPIDRIIRLQLLIVMIATGVFFVVQGWPEAMSALIGGLVAFFPNLYMGGKIKKSSGQDAKKIVNSFYAGESGKLILTAMLFVLVFQLPQINIMALLSGYGAALTVFWVALFMRN